MLHRPFDQVLPAEIDEHIYNLKNPSSVFLARLRPRGEGHHAPGSPRAGGIPAAAEHAGVPDPPCRSRSARLERDPLPRRAHVQRIRRMVAAEHDHITRRFCSLPSNSIRPGDASWSLRQHASPGRMELDGKEQNLRVM